MSIHILPEPNDGPAPGLVPITITVWVKHPELGEVIRDLAASLATSLNVYFHPLAIQTPPAEATIADPPPDALDALEGSHVYPGRAAP